jgi:hypothetical protein
MIEAVIHTLLSVPAVQAVVGGRIALEQLPQGGAYPALVYRVVSTVPVHRLCAPQFSSISRVQVNPVAADMATVNALHALACAALQADVGRTVGATRVVACRLEGYGPATKDDFTGMWTKPADYMLIHE